MTSPLLLKTELEAMLARCTFNVISFTEHHFEPFGYTALWLLGESHLAIHTFPDFGKTYLELSSCMMDKYMLFLAELEQLLASCAHPTDEPIQSTINHS